MACLRIGIRPVNSQVIAECEKVGGITASIRILKNSVCQSMKVVTSIISGVAAFVKNIGADMRINAERVGSAPSISVGIVCAVGLDKEYYLQVFEGNIITIDGCFIKVEKR